MKNKIIYSLTICILVSAFLLISYILYMLIYPFNVAELQRFEVINKEVNKGEFLELKLEVKKNLNIKPKVEWYLADGIVYRLNTQTRGISKPIGNNNDIVKLYIPNTDAIPSGEYYVRIEIEYPVFGNLNVIRYSWSSDKFFIK